MHNRQSLDRVDDDEKLIAKIHRHPFGIVMLYLQLGFGLVGGAALLIYLLPSFIDREENPEVYTYFGLGFVIIAIFLILVMIVATILYRQSMIIVTDKTITQVLQDGLFNRKLSQLSLANIEDVTANRRGVFQTMMNYGTLTIETAGEQQNFFFYYCPRPSYYAKMILESREELVKQPGGEGHQQYAQPYYPPQQQPYPPQPYQQQYTQAPAAPPPPPAQQQSPATPETDYHGPA